MLTPELTQMIDEHRRRGRSHEALQSMVRGVAGDQTEQVLAAYGATPLPDGRRRDQVNLGDPEEQDGP